MVGFAAAIIAGLSVDNPATTTLFRALLAMFACYLGGLGMGAIAQSAMQENVDRYKIENPLDDTQRKEDAPPTAPQQQVGAANRAA
jgi:hypothetical protein